MQYHTLFKGFVNHTPKYILSAVFFLSVLITGCSQNDNDTKGSRAGNYDKSLSHIYEKLGPYQGWLKKRIDNVVFIYSPDQPDQDEFETYAKVFAALERKSASFLKIDPPDSMTVYMYNNLKHGITVTGFLTPFSEGEVIHFWLPCRAGQPVTKRLLPIWSDKVPKHKFVKEGILALLDGTGENYHIKTQQFIESGRYIPLKTLAADTLFESDKERYKSAMAASFVDYVVYAYGILFLKELYESQGDFEEDVESIFKLPVDSLEQQWLEVVKRVATVQPDSTK